MGISKTTISQEKADALRARLTGLSPGEVPAGWMAILALDFRVSFRRRPPK